MRLVCGSLSLVCLMKEIFISIGLGAKVVSLLKKLIQWPFYLKLDQERVLLSKPFQSKNGVIAYGWDVESVLALGSVRLIFTRFMPIHGKKTKAQGPMTLAG